MEKPIFKFTLQDNLDASFLPTRATLKSSGWDVRSAETIFLHAGEYIKINLGIKAFCPDGWWLELKPRSSTFTKKQLHALYGTIDEDYEGNLMFACKFSPEVTDTVKTLIIHKGDAIGQLLPVKRQEMIVEQVSLQEYERLCMERKAERGAGGFGSTGN
jgi:deoxyuridine 5'-triphosphate nucleotidohydrolase